MDSGISVGRLGRAEEGAENTEYGSGTDAVLGVT